MQPLWESEARPSPKKEGRAVVLDAAANAFMERGYNATTLDDVALLLGTTKGQIYHYYRKKLDLFFDVAVGAFYMVHEQIAPLTDMKGVNAVDRLRSVIHAYAMEIMRTYPFHRVALEATQFELIAGQSTAQERAQARILTLRNKLENKLSRLIEEAADEADFRVHSIPLATKAAVGSLNWLIVWFDPKRQTSLASCEKIAAGIADFVIAGLSQADRAA